MSIVIRKGKEQDLPMVLELVKELADFEKAPDEVEVTVNEMRNWGFGEKPLFEFFVLKKNGNIVAMALYYYKYSTWKGKCLFLEDIIVTKSERNNGYGQLLFKEVMQVAKAEKVKRMEWQVLDWNTAAIEFYKKYNSLFDAEWINCKLNYHQLQELPDTMR